MKIMNRQKQLEINQTINVKVRILFLAGISYHVNHPLNYFVIRIIIINKQNTSNPLGT